MTAEGGWHPDPWGEARVRWWNGREWTEWTDTKYNSSIAPGQGPEPSQGQQPGPSQDEEDPLPEAQAVGQSGLESKQPEEQEVAPTSETAATRTPEGVPQKPWYRRWWSITGIVLAVLIVAIVLPAITSDDEEMADTASQEDLEDAYDQGYEEGYDEGVADAEAEGEEKVAKLQETLDKTEERLAELEETESPASPEGEGEVLIRIEETFEPDQAESMIRQANSSMTPRGRGFGSGCCE